MKVQVYSFHDLKTGFFLPPMFYHNTPDAMRGVKRVSLNEHHPISQFPDDYDLYQLAEFDDNSGTLTSLPKPLRLASVNDCIGPKTTS